MAVADRIERIFHEVLGVDVPSSTTDIVAEGLLDSLGIVTLLFELEQQFGVTIPLEDLDLDNFRTLESIDALIERTAGSASTLGAGDPKPVTILPLRPGTGERPLFFVHALGGDVLHLRPLIEAIRTDRPVYGLQAQALDPRQQPQRRVEEMADSYVRAIRLIAPDGPYTLAGFSFGGLVAFEMARILTAANEPIASLLLIDTYVHHDSLARPARWWFLIKRPFRYVHFALKAPRTRIPRYLRRTALHFFPRLPIARPLREVPVPPQLEPIAEIADEAFAAYRPGDYAGDATLLLADHPFPGEAKPVKIWRARVQGTLTVLPFPGSHADAVTNIPRLAAFITDLLAKEP